MVKGPMGIVVGVLIAALGSVAGTAPARAAEGASTLTPDQLTFLVSKDVGVERWVVSLNVSPSDPAVIANVTGNVFKSDGSPPSFVVCRPRADSTGSLADPASTFRFVCDGADACQATARECAQSSWSRIADDVALPSRFFLPEAGLAAAAAHDAPERGLAGRVALAVADLRAWAGRVAAPWFGILAPASATAQANDRGATLSFDGLSYLVNKDLANERWSIGLNYLPVRTAEGGVVSRLGGITGNVLRGEDAPPTFIFCTVRDDSTGTLDDPSSTFRLSCFGADGCTSTAEECARNDWTQIADDVPISASFFLPPGGLPATPQSDPEIVVIGRTSDPPAIMMTDFVTTATSSAAEPAGACAVGTTCFVPRLGTCTDVAGRIADVDGTCGCLVEDVPGECITCGDGATGQCGGDCSYPVGDATARGTCLPDSSGSDACICYAIGAGAALELESCGGPLAGTCPDAHCCTDDPRDGCTSDGTASCSGICVAGTCDDGGDACGSCFPIGELPTPRPTAVPTPSPDETAAPTPTRTPSPTLTPRATPTSVGPTPRPTATPGATAAPTPGPTAKPTVTPRPTPTKTPAPSPTPTKSLPAACNNGVLDPNEECEPGGSHCGSGERCSTVTCACFTCSPQTLRLDDGTDSTVTYDLGINVGTFTFEYTAFESDPDRFIVRHDGQTLFDSGCGTYGTTAFIELPGSGSTQVEVEVIANCAPSSGGSWEYILGCPD